MNRKELHQQYVKLGVSIVEDSSAEADVVSDLLDALLVDYAKDVSKLPTKEATGKEQNLISIADLSSRLVRDIADILGYHDRKIITTQKLIETLFPTQEDIAQNFAIPKPDIHGSVEHINTIVLPPDQREVITGSGTGRESSEIVGYDKVGLIEGRIARELQMERKDIQRKKGEIGSNQMRRVSYYFTYIPQRDVTIITNNQYGEGTFVTQGERLHHTETKKTNKGGPDFVSIRFNYDDPLEFLVRLGSVVQSISKDTAKASHVEKVTKERLKSSLRKSHTKIEIISLLQSHRTEFLSMGATDRVKRSLKDKHDKKIIGYTSLCRLFGYKEEPKDLYKDTVFHSLCEKLFGKNIRQKAERAKNIATITRKKEIISLLQSHRTDFIFMWSIDRQKRSLKDEYGKRIISYIDLCRLFGYKEEADDLYKDTIFHPLCEKLFDVTVQDFYVDILQSHRTEFLSMGATDRVKRSLKDKHDKKIIGYISLCRLFGYKEEPNDLIKDTVFHPLCKKLFDVTVQDFYADILQSHRTDFISMGYKDRQKRSLKGKHGKKIIGYTSLCRLFGYQENQDDLYKDTIFHPLCEKLFGKNIRQKAERAKNIATITRKKEIISLLQSHRTDFIFMWSIDRQKRSLKDEYGKRIISYIDLCRLFGFEEEQNDLYKDTVFHSLCEKLFDVTVQDFYVDILQSHRTDFISMGYKDRQKRSLKGKHGKKIIGYTSLCRLFGFEEEQNDLYKDTVFHSLCEKLFGKNIRQRAERAKNIATIARKKEIISLLQSHRTDFISMGYKDRQKRSLKDKYGKKIISYMDLCRLFGYKEEQKDLSKDTVFHPLCKKLFDVTVQDFYADILQSHRTEFLSMGVTDRVKRSLKDKHGKKIISYIDLCRLFGYKEKQKDLFKDTVFHPLCEKLFGKNVSQEKS